MRILYRTLIGLCLMALQALGFANQVIKQSAWLEDPTGKWTLQDVQGREFEPYRGLLNKGYSDKALWIRIEIEPGHAPIDQSQDQLPLVLRVRPSFVDDIRLYDGSASAAKIAGDLHSKSTQPYRTLNHNLFVQQGATPRTLWLRIETTSSRVVHFELLTLQAALAADRAQELFFHVNVSFLQHSPVTRCVRAASYVVLHSAQFLRCKRFCFAHELFLQNHIKAVLYCVFFGSVWAT